MQSETISATQSNAPSLPRLGYSEKEIADAVGISVFFLRKDRRTLRRIPFIRLGDRILYDVDRVRAALRALEEGGAPVKGRKAREVAA